MKTWSVIVLILALTAVTAPAFAAQTASPKATVPKYNPATEAVFK